MNPVVRCMVLAWSGVFWMGLACAAPGAMSADQARHLLLRTGFAPTQADIDAIAGQDARRVVDQLIATARRAGPLHPAPAFVGLPPPVPYRLLTSVEERQAQRREQMAYGLELKRWWMREMVESAAPLQERMTLFWHGHFATSQQKVVRAQSMWQQHGLLRSYALGSFRSLLHGIAKDPAMLVYLDGVTNRRDAPNENFAREVMELFVLGEGRQVYTEQDVREAARAFTGWSLEGDRLQYRFRPLLHDPGTKTVLGRSAPMDGDDVLEVLLQQPAAAEFLVSKLWLEFVSPTPDLAQVRRIGRVFAQTDFDIARALKELLLTDQFWDPANRATLVKSPVELVVGTVRQFGLRVSDTLPLVLVSAQLGQNLLAPPNVKGWPGYTAWIDASSLLGRKRFVSQLFQAQAMGQADTQRPLRSVQFDAESWLSSVGAIADREPDEGQRTRLAQAVLGLPPSQIFEPGTVAVAYLRNLMQDALYQLK